MLYICSGVNRSFLPLFTTEDPDGNYTTDDDAAPTDTPHVTPPTFQPSPVSLAPSFSPSPSSQLPTPTQGRVCSGSISRLNPPAPPYSGELTLIAAHIVCWTRIERSCNAYKNIIIIINGIEAAKRDLYISSFKLFHFL